MKKICTILAITGIFLWTATIFLRDTSVMDYEIIKRILGVMPNFGVTWVGVGIAYYFFPYVFKKEFNERYTLPLLGVIFMVLLTSEAIHHFFLNSPFDIWDMLAGAAASMVVILIYIKRTRN